MSKERKCRVAEAGNTYNYALSIIKNKGYKIFLVPGLQENNLGDFWAIKDKRDFIASDLLKLLGLISIWETFGDEWHTNPQKPDNDKDTYDKIVSRALPNEIDDLEALSAEEF